MPASLLFLFLGIGVGFVALRLIKSPLSLAEQFIWGSAIGLNLISLLSFFLALLLPNQDWATLVSCLAAAALIVYYFNKDSNRQEILKEWQQGKKNWTREELVPWLIVLIPLGLYTMITIPKMMFFRDGALVAGWINVWGDWAVHLRNSTFFAGQTKLSLENPLFSGTVFHYPYLSSYLSAILQRFGLGVDKSLVWPTLVLFGALPAQLYIFARKLTNNKAAGVIFVYIVMFSGGLGIYYVIKDILNGHYFWQSSAYAPMLYTNYTVLQNAPNNNGLWFMNFIMSEFIPQRAFLAGIGTALYVLYTGWTEISKWTGELILSKQERLISLRNILFASVLFGFLPLIHTHSFIALGVILPITIVWLFARRYFRWQAINKTDKSFWPDLLRIGVSMLAPASLLGFSLIYFFVFDLHATGGFIHRITWWMPNLDRPLDNPVWWWFRNAGPLIILGATGFFYKTTKLRPLLLAGLLLFIVCNFISFQPWHFDNLKIMTYWYILWALPAAVILASFPRSLIPVSFIVILLLTGAGAADSLSVTISGTQGGIQLLSKEDVQFAELIKAKIPDQQALFVSATNHDNLLSVLTGKRMYVGYEGWLWSYGMNAGPRIGEVTSMYQGQSEGLNFIKKRKIDYMVIGPQERDKYHPNESLLRNLFPVVVSDGPYLVLRVTGGGPASIPADNP